MACTILDIVALRDDLSSGFIATRVEGLAANTKEVPPTTSRSDRKQRFHRPRLRPPPTEEAACNLEQLAPITPPGDRRCRASRLVKSQEAMAEMEDLAPRR